MPKFKLYNQSQPSFLPPLLSDCLPKSHICFTINDIVDDMDLTAIENTYSDNGSPAYSPRLMTKILFYGHTQGIRSSRKLENRMNEDIAYRYLAANQLPDHGTINLFRKNHLSALKDIFSQIVALGNGLGLTNPFDISIDGTKCQANASRKNLFDQAEIDKLKKRFEDYFAEAEKIDATEDKLFGKSVGYNMIPGMDSPEKEKRRSGKCERKWKNWKERKNTLRTNRKKR